MEGDLRLGIVTMDEPKMNLIILFKKNFLNIFFKFIYSERVREHVQAHKRGRERGEKERPAGSALSAQSPMKGLIPQT